MICPNYDPLFEPNLKLVDYLMDNCISLSNYLSSIREQAEEGKTEIISENLNEIKNNEETLENGNMVFLTRLTCVINKVLKVAYKNVGILNKIIESKLVGTILKNSEMYISAKFNKHLLIQIIQLQKSVLVSKIGNFQDDLLESSIIF